MVFVLTVTLGIICIFVYLKSKRELCSPAIVFSFPFLFMSIIACLNYEQWELDDFHTNTFFVLILGVLSFIIGTIAQCHIMVKKPRQDITDYPDINKNITFYHLSISLLLEIIAFLLYVLLLLRWGATQGAFDLSEAVNLAMIRGKFPTGKARLDLPFLVNSVVICSRAFGYIYCTILAKNIVFKRKGHNVLLSLNIFVPILISLLSGSRGATLELIVAFLAAFLFYYYKKNLWRKALKGKYIILGIFVGILVLIGFFSIKGLIGRATFEWNNFYDEFCEYFGAQEKNLDLFLNGNVVYTKVFGYATISSFYGILNTYLGFNIVDNVSLLTFIVINGKNLGNVYTCFYNYYIDFGFMGVISFSLISGYISQYLYRKAKYYSNGAIDLWLVIYVYVASCLFFCFFGSRFYTNLLDASFIRFIIWLFINTQFLSRFTFAKKK